MSQLSSSARRIVGGPVASAFASKRSTDLGASRRRPSIIRVVMSLLIVGVLAAFLAGVATNHLPGLAGGNTTTAGPVAGGSIVDGLFLDPDTLLPYRAQSTPSVEVDQAIWAPLWYGDPQGTFHEGLVKEIPNATNGDVSSDLTTFTIKLKSGLKWSDGSPLTADDCAFSYNLYGDPAYGNMGGFPTTDPADPTGFVGATAIDRTTFTIQFRHGFAEYLAAFADGISSCLPKEFFGKLTPGAIANSPQNFWPTIVSGPFTIKERVGGDHITVVRNPDYYQGPDKPYLDQITFKLFGDAHDPNPRLSALQMHAADTSWFLDPTMLASYKAIAGYTTYLDRYPAGYEVLVFNLADPLMSDHAVRQAITMGIDLNTIISTILDGTAKLTCDDHAGNFAHEESLVPCYHFDPAVAGQLLDADGWAVGADGYRHKNGQILELEYATTGRFPRGPTQALIRDELRTVGMKIDLKVYSEGDFFGGGSGQVLAGGHFQMAEFANSGSYAPDDHYFLASDQTPDKGGSNYMHYANPEVDAQERIQQSAADQDTRKAAFHIMHEDVLKDLPVMYLYAAQNVACARSDLHNYNPSALGASETWNVWDWYLGR